MKTSFYISFLALLSLTSSKRNLPKVDIQIESLCDECVYLIKSSILEYYNFNYEALQKTCPGANCLHAHAGQMLRNDEIIVYKEDQCTIKYLIELQ